MMNASFMMTSGTARAALLLLVGALVACNGDKGPAEDTDRPQLDDADGDGYGAEADCDDADAAVSPGAPELCNGVDDDCDGLSDEDGASDGTRWYPDADGDSYGDAPSGVLACAQPEGWVADSTDCDDANGAISPGADEICDTLDNDCDGEADEEGAADGIPAHRDTDADGYGEEVSVLVCDYTDGYVANGSDCDDDDAGSYPGGVELCDDADNDCDGEVDDDARDADTYYEDSDGDRYGLDTSTMQACSTPDGYSSRSGDCDDDKRSTYPGADERCDDEDNDCDGEIDDDPVDANHWYTDSDGDEYGDEDTEVVTCEDLSGDGVVGRGGDCDDDDSAVHPGVEETWYDGIDQDCDGQSDYDQDEDGYVLGTLEDEDAVTVNPGTGEVVEDGSTTEGGDCDDEDRRVHPDQRELCDDADNDCDGEIDEDAADGVVYYVDIDADTYGDEASAESLCDVPDYEYVIVGGDCDDADADVNPGVEEPCSDDDGVDNDCDSTVDEVCYYGEMNYLYQAGTDPDAYECDLWFDMEWVESADLCPDCEYGFVTALDYQPDISDNSGRCVDERDPDMMWTLGLDVDYGGSDEARLWYGFSYDYDYDYDYDTDYGAAPPAPYTYWAPLFDTTFDEATGALTFSYGYFYAYDYGPYTYYYGNYFSGNADLAGLGG